MATIQELSKRCGVSISTISKALNGYSDISDKTRELVIDTANKMGYFPNANVRALKLKKTYTIGVLINSGTNSGLRNDYYANILSAFKEEAALKGFNIIFIEHHIGTRAMTYLDYCQYQQLDGACILCADYSSEEIIKLLNSDIPTVTIDYPNEKSISIMSDNYGGMKQLTNFIIRQGHTEIALIHGVASTITKKRIDGFVDAMQESGLKVPKEFIIESSFRNPAMAEEVATMLLQQPVRPTCIIAPDDLSAAGVLSAIRKQSLQVVKDISVTGYDSVETNQFIGIKLTTMKQERDYIGIEAAKKLIRRIDKEDDIRHEDVYIKQTLVIGNSVRKIK